LRVARRDNLDAKQTYLESAVVTPAQTIYLISCVSVKRAKPAPARDLYVSELFRRARAYVEATACPWFILSAKHHFADPYCCDRTLE
jgi:hypothetical protein